MWRATSKAPDHIATFWPNITFFCSSVALVSFADCSHFNDFNGLCEQALHQSVSVCSIDPAKGDSHQRSTTCHEIATKPESDSEAVTDAGTVEVNETTQLLHNGSSGGFDAEGIEYLYARDILDTHHGLQNWKEADG